MINFAWMMGFIGVAVGLMVGIFVFSAVEDGMDCPDVATNPEGNEACQKRHRGPLAPSAIWALSSTKQANFTVAVVLPRSAWTRQLTWSAGQFRLLKLKPQQPR